MTQLMTLPADAKENTTVTIGGVTYKFTGGVWNVVSQVEINLRQQLKRLAAEAGFNLVDGSFEEGAVLTSSSDVAWHQTDDKYYAWSGAFPKTVAPGLDPTVTVGFIMRTSATYSPQNIISRIKHIKR